MYSACRTSAIIVIQAILPPIFTVNKIAQLIIDRIIIYIIVAIIIENITFLFIIICCLHCNEI